MKRLVPTLGCVALSLLLAACSSSGDDPPSFALGLEGALEAEYDAPFTIASVEGQAYVASPLSRTRTIATTKGEAGAAAKQLFTTHAASFGAPTTAPSFVESPSTDAADVSVSLTQVVPGTKVEIVGKGALLVLADDGTMVQALGALVDDPKLPRDVTTNASDVERRVVAIVAGWALPESPVPEMVGAPELIAVPGTNVLSVRWRASFKVGLDGFEAELDAYSLEPLHVGRASAAFDGVPAKGPAKQLYSYPLAQLVDPLESTAPLEVETTKANGKYYLVRNGDAAKSEIVTKECTGSSATERIPRSEYISSPTDDEFLGTLGTQGFKVNGVGLLGPGIAVNVHHNAVLVDRYFRDLFGFGPTKDGKMEGIIHRNDLFEFSSNSDKGTYKPDGGRLNAFFDPIAKLVSFGDGGYMTGLQTWIKPPGVALDIAAHEWTHAYLKLKKDKPLELFGEDGAMQEAIADVIGVLVAARAGQKDLVGIGRRMPLDGSYLRNFSNPVATMAVRSDPADNNQLGRVKLFTNSPNHRRNMDKDCILPGIVDQGCVHFNSTPLSHAFYLMVHGGSVQVNGLKRTRVAVPAGNFGTIERLWVNSAKQAPAIAPPEPPPIAGEPRFMKMEAMALQQLDLARVVADPATRAAVGCAWYATGFVTRGQLGIRGISCVETLEIMEGAQAAPSDCGGKIDGYHCDPQRPYSAILCKAGSIAGGMQCKSGSVCVRKAPASTEATTTTTGAPACEELP